MKATIKVLAPAKQVAAKTVHTIKVSNYKYDPQALTIKVGDTVNWEGLSGHDVVEAKEENSCSSKSGGLAIMPKSPSNTFKAAGVFNYYCSVGSHCSRGMKATITVVE